MLDYYEEQLETVRKKYEDKFKEFQEPLRKSEFITEEDLSITINPCDIDGYSRCIWDRDF